MDAIPKYDSSQEEDLNAQVRDLEIIRARLIVAKDHADDLLSEYTASLKLFNPITIVDAIQEIDEQIALLKLDPDFMKLACSVPNRC